MPDRDTDQICEAIKAEWLVGGAAPYRELFEWLWTESKKRCPLLRPKTTERYISFEIPPRSPVVRIDPQKDGLKLGFSPETELFGLRRIHFPEWNHRVMDGLLLARRDDRVLLAIEDAYANRCADIPMFYEPSEPFKSAKK